MAQDTDQATTAAAAEAAPAPATPRPKRNRGSSGKARSRDTAPDPDAFGSIDASAGDEPSPADAPDAIPGEVVDQAPADRPKRGRGRPTKAQVEADRTAAETAAALKAAAVGGATIAYTLAGAGVQVVGFSVAGFVMQSQAEPAGAALAESAKGTRFYGAFAKLGAGSTLAPFIVGPMLAEAFVRFPPQRARLLPMLGLVIPTEALEQIVAVYPVPEAAPPAPTGDPTAAAPMAGANGGDPAAAAQAEWEARRAAEAAEQWPS